MSRYDNYSREELIRRIEELEGTQDVSKPQGGRFREQYACKILDSLPDMLTVLDRSGAIVELVSSEETNHVGVTSAEIVGKDIRTILSPEACRNVKNNLENVFATNCGGSSYHDITLDGHTRNYENRIIPLDGENALCICRDITEAEKAKHELEMVKYALNNVDEEIYACDLEGTMEYANEQFRAHHAIEGDITRFKVYEFWAGTSTRPQWEECLEQIRKSNGAFTYTVHFKDEGGKSVSWDIVAYIIYDYFKEREIVWFFGRDVSQRLERDNKVQEMNSVLESILNNIPVYIFVKDPGNEFRYLYWNRAFEEYSHIPASKAIGHTDFEVFPNPKDAEHFHRDDQELLRCGDRMKFTEEYVTATGETRIVSTSKILVPMENRMPLIIGLAWDITEQRNSEMSIVEARIRAEESDRLKSTFLANMSHEIRTPLNAIVGFAKLVGMAETEEEKQEYVDIIETNSNLLLQLVNDILDISKIEAGTLDFCFRTMDADELCRSEYEVHKTRVKPGVSLIYETTGAPVEIECDRNRLAQVISNLLNNASKFTERGEIRFGFDRREEDLLFYVQDTGTGIPADKVEQIFNRFVKLNDLAAGTGLGLAISKMIVEKMNGEIGVESEVGKGTRFWFTVPLRHRHILGEPESEACEACAKCSGDQIWTLLVGEESNTCYRLIEAVLGRRFRLIRVRTGAEVIDFCEKQQFPDAVLMDTRMSVVDGFETARRIRALAPDIPLVAMSAYPSDREIAAAREAGFDDFVAKPLSQTALNRALNGCLVDLK